MNETSGAEFDQKGARQDLFSVAFRWMFVIGFALIIFYALSNLVFTAWIVYHSKGDILQGGLTIRLVQVSLGMMIGFFSIFLGLLAAWMGVQASFDGEAGLQDYKIKLASASPGVLLILCGTVVVGICLTKEVGVSGLGTGVSDRQAVVDQGTGHGPGGVDGAGEGLGGTGGGPARDEAE